MKKMFLAGVSTALLAVFASFNPASAVTTAKKLVSMKLTFPGGATATVKSFNNKPATVEIGGITYKMVPKIDPTTQKVTVKVSQVAQQNTSEVDQELNNLVLAVGSTEAQPATAVFGLQVTAVEEVE